MLFWQKQKPRHEQAMDCFKANMVPGQGILVHTRQPVPYPELTGYFIPTLNNWGEKELARTCTKWLMSTQLPDGADGVSYTFDTAQIMRGLCAALGDVDGTEDTLRRARYWMLTLVELTGDNRTAQIFDLSTQPLHDLELLPATAFEDVAAADFDNDMDNDMDVDVFLLASGDIGQQENPLLLNDGKVHFQVVTAVGGAAGSLSDVVDSATTVDLDGEGFLDLFLANGGSMGRSLGLPSGGSGYQLFRNVGNGNH